jgi:Asp-tRNA(Asn)/Glu-tRNA(Gln) amidotransferase A subunit family amidase
MADVTLLFLVLCGALDIDPIAASVSSKSSSVEALKQIRVGYFEDDGMVPVTAETRQAVQAAAHSLRRHGFHVEPFRPQSLDKARELWYTFFVRCGAMLLEPLARGRESELSPTFLDFLSIAHKHHALPADELLIAWCEIDTVRSQFLTEMRDFPILLTPVCSIPAFRHGERNWTLHDANGTPKSLAYLDAMRFTQWFNLLGAPAAAVPIGLSADGLPIGVQLAGRPYADEEVLGIAAILEQDFGYTAPPMLRPLSSDL